MDHPVINASQINKSYDGREVLKGLDLRVGTGELVAIMGKSGSGKSTLLHILGTLDRPDSGEVAIRGEYPFRLSKNQLSDFRNRNIGFVFQFHHLLPEFDLLENVKMPGHIARTDKKVLHQKALELIDYFGLTRVMLQKPAELSGGEQQRAAICRALINQPGLILADEPTGNLDTRASDEIAGLLRLVADEWGRSVIMVTHDPRIAAYADRIIFLKDGSIVNETQLEQGETQHLPLLELAD